MSDLGVAFRSRAGQGAVVGIAGARERTIIQGALQTSIIISKITIQPITANVVPTANQSGFVVDFEICRQTN